MRDKGDMDHCLLFSWQALVLKYLLFVSDDEADAQLNHNEDALMTNSSGKSSNVASGDEIDSKLVYMDPRRTR